MTHIPLSRPEITPLDKRKVLKVLNTPHLSCGPRVKEFERKFAAYIGRKYAVAVNSGTGALHLTVRALGLKEGDEVITTPFSFIASANCLLFEKVRPVFVDIRPDTLNIDPAKIPEAITPKTKAILAVDIFGHPADWDALRRIARKHRWHLIEDSCEALGSTYKGRKAGSFGTAAAFAFYPNKQITSAEGGMIVTDDRRISEICRSLRNQGADPGRSSRGYGTLGYSYRLSDIHSSLGVTQLGQIGLFLRRRGHVAEMYTRGLSGIAEIEPPFVSPDVRMGWFVYVIKLKEKFARRRARLLSGMRTKGIECGIYFPPIHLQPLYRQRFGYGPGDFPVAENVARRVLALPFYNRLTPQNIRYIINTLKETIRSTT